jgi:hypothetical protein
MPKRLPDTLICVLVCLSGGVVALPAEPGHQRPIALVERMPRIPQPFRVIDWKAKARAFDRRNGPD